LSAEATLSEQQHERDRWYELHARAHAQPSRPFANDRNPDRRLRIGYVSADFQNHSAAFAFSPLILHHDRSEFEVFCYSCGSVEDQRTKSLRKAAENWRSAGGLSDEALAAQIRADRIDILVDLSGHTQGHRLFVFARKPAPIQMTGWGFGSGTGLRTMDYLFSDPVTIPQGVRHLFAERIIDLPCCMCFEAPRDAPPVSALPALQGKPFTFGSINRTEKMSARSVALWSRILRAMPASRLLLKSYKLELAGVRSDVIGRFGEQGISPERLLLLGGTHTYDHLKALHQVDLALDPLPNGGITTAETLWMGVPVLALPGGTPSCRVSAAILTAVGMPDWITRDEDEYVRIALDFADDPDLLSRIRGEMRQRVASSLVFDVKRYAALVEDAYRNAWRQWCVTAQ
jgi:predicted O-linked N-acetylglucosamine transferase (SPINDLY family)